MLAMNQIPRFTFLYKRQSYSGPKSKSKCVDSDTTPIAHAKYRRWGAVSKEKTYFDIFGALKTFYYIQSLLVVLTLTVLSPIINVVLQTKTSADVVLNILPSKLHGSRAITDTYKRSFFGYLVIYCPIFCECMKYEAIYMLIMLKQCIFCYQSHAFFT